MAWYFTHWLFHFSDDLTDYIEYSKNMNEYINVLVGRDEITSLAESLAHRSIISSSTLQTSEKMNDKCISNYAAITRFIYASRIIGVTCNISNRKLINCWP